MEMSPSATKFSNTRKILIFIETFQNSTYIPIILALPHKTENPAESLLLTQFKNILHFHYNFNICSEFFTYFQNNIPNVLSVKRSESMNGARMTLITDD